MSMQRTLVLIKPDGVQRGLIGDIVSRFERRGLRLAGMKLMQMSEDLAGRHYAEHRAKPFFGSLVGFITSAPVVAMVWEAPEAVTTVRSMMGATNPANATPGTIRGDYAVDIGMNIVHGSDSPERAEQEVALFFREDELAAWDRTVQRWVTET